MPSHAVGLRMCRNGIADSSGPNELDNGAAARSALSRYRLVIGGRCIGRVLAAKTLDAMFLVGRYLTRNREPSIKSKVGN
jgi:hypothetical protein